MDPSIELLKNCRQDNRKAHHELYLMCFPVLKSICKRYYNNKEDEMSTLNLIFLKIITKLDLYLDSKKNVPFEAWIRKIAIHQIIDLHRKNKLYRETIALNDQTELYGSFVEESFLDKENKEHLMHIINCLPTMSKTVFNLYFIDGYKHEEIAELLGISSNTSKVHLMNAKRKLKELLTPIKQEKVPHKTALP